MGKNNYTHCTKYENWLKKSGGYPSHDFEITIPIDISLGVGAKHIHDGDKLVTLRPTESEKTIRLKISSWIGYDGDAEHVYGKLIIPHNVSITKDGSTLSSSGYGVPNYISGWDIELTRKVTQKEIDDDKKRTYDKKWEWHYVGDNTTRFNTEEELIHRATYIFVKWFTGGWKFKLEE